MLPEAGGGKLELVRLSTETVRSSGIGASGLRKSGPGADVAHACQFEARLATQRHQPPRAIQAPLEGCGRFLRVAASNASPLARSRSSGEHVQQLMHVWRSFAKSSESKAPHPPIARKLLCDWSNAACWSVAVQAIQS